MSQFITVTKIMDNQLCIYSKILELYICSLQIVRIAKHWMMLYSKTLDGTYKFVQNT